jgi:Ca-activated chloride channel family protein
MHRSQPPSSLAVVTAVLVVTAACTTPNQARKATSRTGSGTTAEIAIVNEAPPGARTDPEPRSQAEVAAAAKATANGGKSRRRLEAIGRLAGTASQDRAARPQAIPQMQNLSMNHGAAGYAASRSFALAAPPVEFHTEQYDVIDEEGFVEVANRPLSTFSVDVDTASYSNIRRLLNDGTLPPSGAVRVEEMINYFSYEYPQPDGDDPFSVSTEQSAAPWNEEHRLVLIGLQGREIEPSRVPARNLVFLVDVSGSMQPANKLPLLRKGLTELARQMRPEDHVAIVVYAGASGCVLEPTSGRNRQRIVDALARLEAGGSTNGASGIRQAYDLAREHFVEDGINRVILATDGDFNVGTTSRSELVELVEKERESGVFLTVLGVGTDNLKDATMEQLADRGNGNYAYLDTAAEARKVLVEEGGGTLVTIAKDVKIQVEFNPTRVQAYRLIGYENRRLRDKDFNDDKKDAGEIGAGHTVTALYEVVPVGVEMKKPSLDPLRYQKPSAPTLAADGEELLTVKLRYKQPTGSTSRLLSVSVDDLVSELTAASENLRFAAAVASFGMVLAGSEDRGLASLEMAQSLGRDALGEDPNAYRAEFVRLVVLARGLSDQRDGTTAHD